MGFEYAGKSKDRENSVNSQIRSKEVRLINEKGEQVGVLSTIEALRRAQALGLDLVTVNGNSEPPVCKILDYGKFRYEQSRKEKEMARKARESQADVKEIQLRPNTDDHDIGIKARRAQGFLAGGDKVKVVVKFKGRELNHTEIGRKVLETFLGSVGEYKFDRQIAMSERQMFAVLAPASKK